MRCGECGCRLVIREPVPMHKDQNKRAQLIAILLVGHGAQDLSYLSPRLKGLVLIGWIRGGCDLAGDFVNDTYEIVTVLDAIAEAERTLE